VGTVVTKFLPGSQESRAAVRAGGRYTRFLECRCHCVSPVKGDGRGRLVMDEAMGFDGRDGRE